MHLADRVDRRQVHHVETHLGDPRQRLGRGRERAVNRVAVVVPATGGPGEELVPRAEPGQRPVHPDAVLLTARDHFAQRILRRAVRRPRRASAAPARVNGSPGSRSRAAASKSGSRSLRGVPAAARSSSRAPTSRSLDSSASPWPASSLAVTPRRHVAIGSPQPSTRNVHRPDAVGNELAVEHVRRAARGHRYELRLHPCRWADHILDRHRFGRRRPGRVVHELRVRGAVVAHHQGGCHGVVALPPHRGPHRHHLAHDGLGRIPSARDDGLRRHQSRYDRPQPTPFAWRGAEPRGVVRRTARAAPCCPVSFTASSRPIPTVVSTPFPRARRRHCGDRAGVARRQGSGQPPRHLRRDSLWDRRVAVLDGEASALVVLGPVGLRRNRAVRHEVAGSVVNAPLRRHLSAPTR